MYAYLYLLYTSAAVLIVLLYLRRLQIIKKICAMPEIEKTYLLSNAVRPYGFTWQPDKQAFTSIINAWQRDYGYCQLFDEVAPRFNVLADCEPVYFDYDGKTWLIEIWKGQYGIHTGAAIGIYHADHRVSPIFYPETRFQSANNKELMKLSYRLIEGSDTILAESSNHWWLTGFTPKHLVSAADLRMPVCITFPNLEMMDGFIDSLLILGYSLCELSIYQTSVSFCFIKPKGSQPSHCSAFHNYFIALKNRIMSQIYAIITRQFTNTQDKLVYLYFYLPPIFLRIACMTKSNRRYQG